VRQQAVILYSSTVPYIERQVVDTSGLVFTLASIDHKLLPMPSGTKVAIELADRTEGNELNCSLDKLINTTVPNISPTPNPAESLVTTHTATFKGCANGDVYSIKITAPSGLETVQVYTFGQ
jgi:hypothetical protein